MVGHVISDQLDAQQQSLAVANIMNERFENAISEALQSVTDHSIQLIDETKNELKDSDELQIMSLYTFTIHVMTAVSLLRTIYSLLGVGHKFLSRTTSDNQTSEMEVSSSFPRSIGHAEIESGFAQLSRLCDAGRQMEMLRPYMHAFTTVSKHQE